MTITLGGITLSDNMYLSGLESAPRAAVSQKRTILGTSILTVSPLIGGRRFTIGSDSKGATRGIWCYHTIEAIKELENQGVAVVLDYRGDIYEVVIVGTSFRPMILHEPEGPNKKFIGTISVIEA